MSRSHLKLVVVLIVLATVLFVPTSAQESCPNTVTFGIHPSRVVDKTVRSQIEITYFTTDDPNVFIPETAGISGSSSFTHLATNSFVSKLEQLDSKGLANVRKHGNSTLWFGETAELSLERLTGTQKAKLTTANFQTSQSTADEQLERRTEISIEPKNSLDGDYIRLGVLSFFITGGSSDKRAIVDYDGSVLMKPGETTVFKLRSDFELGRNGSKRSYVAVTIHAVEVAGNLSTDLK